MQMGGNIVNPAMDAALAYADGAFTDANFKLPEVVRFAFFAGAAWQREQDAQLVNEWPSDYRSKDGLMVLSSRFDIARAILGHDDRATSKQDKEPCKACEFYGSECVACKDKRKPGWDMYPCNCRVCAHSNQEGKANGLG